LAVIADNNSGIAEGGKFQHYRFMELQMFNYLRQPRFWQYHVGCRNESLKPFSSSAML
jgi:hypothetical protein